MDSAVTPVTHPGRRPDSRPDARPDTHPATCRGLAPARAWLPDSPLRSAVLGTLARPAPAGHGAPTLCGLTHLPALPAALLIWVQASAKRTATAAVRGGLQEAAGSQAALAAGLYLCGPHERPHTLVHAPEAELTLVVLRPEVWRAHMHTDWSTLRDRLVPAHEWCDVAHGLLAQGLQPGLAAPERGRLLEALLGTGPPTAAAACRDQVLQGWWPGLEGGPAGSPGEGLARRPVGERQRERLTRTWTGLTPRMLRAQARAEAALVHAAALLRRGQLDWRQVALVAGYTDQPHLCRETRRLTGFSPVQLMQGMLGQEPFWVYRAWALARLGRSPAGSGAAG